MRVFVGSEESTEMKVRNNRKLSSMLGSFAMSILLLGPIAALPRFAFAAPPEHRSLVTRTRAPSSKGALALPEVVVQKNPGCACCELWAEHLREHGFKVQVSETAELAVFKQKVGIPAGKGSCHTALVDGMFVEGHVPADSIEATLAIKPRPRGLVLPGMPAGSPGMPAPPGGAKPFTVEGVDAKGDTHPFRTYNP